MTHERGCRARPFCTKSTENPCEAPLQRANLGAAASGSSPEFCISQETRHPWGDLCASRKYWIKAHFLYFTHGGLLKASRVDSAGFQPVFLKPAADSSQSCNHPAPDTLLCPSNPPGCQSEHPNTQCSVEMKIKHFMLHWVIAGNLLYLESSGTPQTSARVGFWSGSERRECRLGSVPWGAASNPQGGFSLGVLSFDHLCLVGALKPFAIQAIPHRDKLIYSIIHSYINFYCIHFKQPPGWTSESELLL